RQGSPKLARRFRALIASGGSGVQALLPSRPAIDIQNDLLLGRLRAARNQDQLVVADSQNMSQLTGAEIVTVRANAIVFHRTGDIEFLRRNAQRLVMPRVFLGLRRD